MQADVCRRRLTMRYMVSVSGVNPRGRQDFFLCLTFFSRPYTMTGIKMERGVHMIMFVSLYLALFSSYFLTLLGSDIPLRRPQSLLFLEHNRSTFVLKHNRQNQWRTEGGLGCSTPPKFRRPSKIVPNSTRL